MNAPATSNPKPLDTNELKQIADRIRARIRRTVGDIIETGQDLIRVKATLDHGKFTSWIEHEFGMADRTARNYMRAAAWAEGKTEIVSVLPPKALYLLSAKSTPKQIQDEVVSHLEAGKPFEFQTIKARIDMARSEQRLAAKTKLSNRRRTKAEIERSERESKKREAECREHKKQQDQFLTATVSILQKLNRPDLTELVELFSKIDFWSLKKLPSLALEDRAETPVEHENADPLAIPPAFRRKRQ